MNPQELYQNIVSELRDTYLPQLGSWKEHEEEQATNRRIKYFEIASDNYFVGVTVRLESKSSQPTVRAAIFPLSHLLPDNLLKKIKGKRDVFTEPCFVQGRGYGETFNRHCYTLDEAERPILAARDYLQFVVQDEYKKIVDEYNKRIAELEDESKRVETEFAEKLESLVGSD